MTDPMTSTQSPVSSSAPAVPTVWSRRAWLGETSRAAAILAVAPLSPLAARWGQVHAPALSAGRPAWSVGPTAAVLPVEPMQALALTAVEAAKAAGAVYADAKLTRIVQHQYHCSGNMFDRDVELVGLGVRVVVNGYWGFASSPFWTTDEAAQLARNAVLQAKENAKGPTRTVDLGTRPPVVTGIWATPIRIDPFSITIEEKRDFIDYWKKEAEQQSVPFDQNGINCLLNFDRQERVVATSDGSLFSQTTYETAGAIEVVSSRGAGGAPGGPKAPVQGLARAAKGWELFLDAKIPEQFPRLREELTRKTSGPGVQQRPAIVGRYRLVCDGATMANLLEKTLGTGTQLDRALGYEANATGTSFLDDPLGMVGSYHVAGPSVTVTANRSAPAQLATVKWDDEGVVPADLPLVKDGVLVDFQTTREQAAWLAPYYQKAHRPLRSNGYAASESGLATTLQMMPNLAMMPDATSGSLDDFVAAVPDGILIENAWVDSDWQGRSGLILGGTFRQIKYGRLGAALQQGAIMFDTLDFWKKISAVGNASTVGGLDVTQYELFIPDRWKKGEPPQATSHSVRAVAAIIENQPLINPMGRA